MSIKHNRQAGIAALGIIMVLLVLGAVGGIGWYVHSRQKDTSSKSAPMTSSSISQAPQATIDGSKAATLVKAFYEAYDTATSSSGIQQEAVIKQYGTPNLAFYDQYYEHGFNPISCSQLGYDSVTVKTTATTASTATVAVTEITDKAVAPEPISVTVVNRDGLKIDSLTCPGKLGNLPPAETPGP